MNWELLHTSSSRTGKKSSVVLAERLFEHFECGLVVQVWVEIVHFFRIRSIEVDGIACWDPLTKVGLGDISSNRGQIDEQTLNESTPNATRASSLL
jgi:hypothetical protein